MPHTKEVEEFLKSIGPFYEVADSDEESRAAFTPNDMDDVTDEAANQSTQIQSHDLNISADLDITVNIGMGILYLTLVGPIMMSI